MIDKTLTALVLAMACGTALAADATTPPAAPAPDCASLERTFDTAKKEHVSTTKLKDAKTQRTKGGELCASGNTSEGIKALKLALRDIGVN